MNVFGFGKRGKNAAPAWYHEVRNCGGDCQRIVMRVQTGPQVPRRMILRMFGVGLGSRPGQLIVARVARD